MTAANVTFCHTEKALFQLEDQLKCCICCNFARSPVTLGGCEHLFCSVCSEDYMGKSCPICNIPAHVKDAEKDRQLYNLAKLCHRLRQVLAGEDTEAQCPAVTSEEIIESTPNQPIIGSVPYKAKNTPTGNITKQNKHQPKQTNCSSEKKAAKSSSSSKGRERHTPLRKSTVTQCDDNDSTDDVQQEKKEKRTIKVALRSKQSKRRRKSEPGNQSTMTQFYDCDDSDEGSDKPKKTRKKLTNKTSCEPHEQATMTQYYDKEDDVEHESKSDIESKGNEESVKGLRSRKHKLAGKPAAQKTRLRHSLGGHEVLADLKAMSESCTETAEQATKVKTTATRDKRNNRKSPRSTSDTKSPQIKKNTTSAETSTKEAAELAKSPAVSQKNVRRKSTAKSDKQETIPLSKNQLTSHAANPLVKSRVICPAIDKRNAKGETALQVAAIKNDVNKVQTLLASGANPNVRDNAGWTPLHEACNHGYLEVATLLLDNGAMISVPGLENDTALHDAINNNRLDCVKLLVSRGASLTLRNMHGQTPIDLALTDVMKKALKTPVVAPAVTPDSQPLDVLEYQQPCLLGTGLSRDEKITLQKAGSQLKVRLTEEVTPEVTHIVTRCNAQGMCPRTIKLLQGLLMGKWIMNMEWLATCMEVGSLVCEEAFEVQGTSLSPNSQAPNKGRMNRKLQLPGLFNGCQFYFHGSFEYATPSKEELVSLVKGGDGQLLIREPKIGHLDDLQQTVPYHSDPASEMANCCVFIVHENQVKFRPIRSKQMCSVPVSWIMDSACHFRLVPLPEV